MLFVQAPEIGRLIETGPVPEIVCSRLARIEFFGDGQACFVLVRNGISPDSGADERVVVGRVFASVAFIAPAIELGVAGLVKAGLVHTVTTSRRLFS